MSDHNRPFLLTACSLSVIGVLHTYNSFVNFHTIRLSARNTPSYCNYVKIDALKFTLM